MGDKSKISWTDATEMVDREGRRVRVYQRRDPTRPGQQMRRRMAADRLSWCRGCRDWLPSEEVKQGACAEHRAAEYRAYYASRPEAIRARVHARKRGIDPVPVEGGEDLLEQFEGTCAYCPAPATTWDHVVPISRGGETLPGNVIPACQSCNSSKGNRDIWEWLASSGRRPHDQFIEVLILRRAA